MATTPRIKWATTYPNSSFRVAKSKRAAYDQVQTDAADGASRTTVHVDEGMGRGWQTYEVIEHK